MLGPRLKIGLHAIQGKHQHPWFITRASVDAVFQVAPGNRVRDSDRIMQGLGNSARNPQTGGNHHNDGEDDEQAHRQLNVPLQFVDLGYGLLIVFLLQLDEAPHRIEPGLHLRTEIILKMSIDRWAIALLDQGKHLVNRGFGRLAYRKNIVKKRLSPPPLQG